MPAFSSPIDCTPWVVGGLWPAELSTITDENATLAEHLRDDLQRITSRTNDELKLIKRAGMDDAARHAAESRVIDEARAHAVRRVESAVRHLHTMRVSARPQYARHPSRQVAGRYGRRDHDQTQVMPAVPAVPPPAVKEPREDKTQVIPAVPVFEPAVEEFTGTEVQPVPDLPVEDDDAEGGRHRISGADDAGAETAVIPAPQGPVEVVEAEPETTRLQELTAFEEETEPEAALPVDDDDALRGRHWISGADDAGAETAVIPAPQGPVEVVEAEPETTRLQEFTAFEEETEPEAALPVDDDEIKAAEGQAQDPGDEAAETTRIREPEDPADPIPTESDSQRLQRLLAFVVRQEPQLNWAVGDRTDGTTVLVTDLAHGWIPPGVALPGGVRLLGPGRRTGKVAALLGDTTRAVTYTPGERVGRPADFAPTEPSVQPRELPAVDDLGWELGRVTHWRDGLPRLVHTLAKAATSGTGVVEEEADLLRVHLDTARYQLLTQYPDVEPALLRNCLLLAATESSVAADPISANYHFAWFQKLDEPPASQWTAES
jgi:Family of unknown function (DUF5631)/Family of unknown function (DUF5632)